MPMTIALSPPGKDVHDIGITPAATVRMEGMARHMRRIRQRIARTQANSAPRILVSTETTCNREQGRYNPTGAERALFRVLDKTPETALDRP